MGNKITIVTATDLHYLAPELQDGGRAFTEMMSLADGRLTNESEGVLDAFVRKMLQKRPDAVVLTGDLTFNAEKESHKQVSRQLARLADAGIAVAVIPGNHDLENPMAGSYLGDEAQPVATVTKEEFQQLYVTCMVKDEYEGTGILSRYPSSLGFVYGITEKLWLLAIDVNGNTYPGEVSRGILLWAEGQLKRAKEKGVLVIGISHQNLMVHNELLSDAYRMAGAQKLADLYRKYGVRLHLSGHMHIQHQRTEQELTEIVTAALTLGHCQYGVLTLDEEGYMDYHAEELQEYSERAKKCFFSINKEKTLWELQEMGLKRKIAGKLADDLARWNLAYVAGRLDLLEDREAIYEAWKTEAPESFWNTYLEGISREEVRNHAVCRRSLR